jgi:hypothetical protein
MDYECASNRKSKNDKKAKRRFRIFKRGGQFRNIETKDK